MMAMQYELPIPFTSFFEGTGSSHLVLLFENAVIPLSGTRDKAMSGARCALFNKTKLLCLRWLRGVLRASITLEIANIDCPSPISFSPQSTSPIVSVIDLPSYECTIEWTTGTDTGKLVVVVH